LINFWLNIRKTMLTPNIDKIRMSGRSNQSFWFPHARSMFQLLAGVEIQNNWSHLQRPSRIVRITERGNSMQQRHFLLLDIQCTNPGDIHLWCFILMLHGLVGTLHRCNMSHFTQDQQSMSQMHLIGQQVLERTTCIQRVSWIQRKPRNNQIGYFGLRIWKFQFSRHELATHDRKGLSCKAKCQYKWGF
jgi:hypothetical protein